MTGRRGLTLIEVLAATVLLALLAATVVPLLRHATNAVQEHDQMNLTELARAADAVLADPAQFSIDSIDNTQEAQVIWPPDSTLVVQRMGSPDATEHEWFVFSWLAGPDDAEPECVFRWVKVNEDPEDENDA